jgi:hypothetical protein
MTTSLKTTAAAIFLFVVTVSPLPAQNNPRSETSNGIAVMAESPSGTNRDPQFTPGDNSGMRAGDPNPTNVKMPRTRAPGWLSVPLGFFITPVVILAVIFYAKNRRTKMMHETLRAMIDKGVPMTPELIASLKPRNDERGPSKCYLLAGLITSGVGIGVMVNQGKPGLIPLLIGAAFLIVWLVEKRNDGADQPPKQ